MKLKDKIKDMSREEMIKLLATDGKLVKRPLSNVLYENHRLRR